MNQDELKEIFDFYTKNDIFLGSEPWGDEARQNYKVLNPIHDWKKLKEEYDKKEYVVVDNFLIPEFAVRLRNFALTTNFRSMKWPDYIGLDFRRPKKWFPLLTNISEEMSETIDILKGLNFKQVWAFMCNNIGSGVALHADPACVNVNLWVTGDESMVQKSGKNGLILWDKKAPKDWSYEDYNGNVFLSRKFLAENGSLPTIIEYKFNRALFFNSAYFHETAGVETKKGHENKRINYTFLFGDKK
jgi:hypothetical protein